MQSSDLVVLSHPLPTLSPVSKLDRRHIGRPRKRNNLLMGERERLEEEPNNTKARKSPVLYTSFNAL
jgi:hypothetical protein